MKRPHNEDAYKALLTDLLFAYYSASRAKRQKATTVRFHMQLMEGLDELVTQILNRTYRPKASICFTVVEPVTREVIAADFRDRVVHHYIYNYLTPHVEKLLIYDCYSCRLGKGTSFGIDRLEHHIRSVSEN